eukprot:CAMPEP_0198110204 /NCGR_PEP_ID=MMETSP1442-20131203/2227_1 /TAXON_ID= /ORGANISM="Craspedostauros australis, Strain CCMP3328" /LENGTH=88 /DNA_ID=CAMNT_0043766161 /DNA_START=19 /DNA_END=282 /DNA_ORIENTATION=-
MSIVVGSLLRQRTHGSSIITSRAVVAVLPDSHTEHSTPSHTAKQIQSNSADASRSKLLGETIYEDYLANKAERNDEKPRGAWLLRSSI